jgi:hypothetical protein
VILCKENGEPRRCFQRILGMYTSPVFGNGQLGSLNGNHVHPSSSDSESVHNPPESSSTSIAPSEDQ